MVGMAKKLKHTVEEQEVHTMEEQEVHTVEVVTFRRDLGDFSS